MKKQALYTYNPATDDFERWYPSLKDRILQGGSILLLAAAIGGALFALVYFGFADRTETELRAENSRLRAQYDVLERRVDASMKVMENIRNRDDNFYRVIMQMDPMSTARRYAGFDYEKSYAGIRRLDDNSIVERLTGEVDLLDRRLYSQIQSFDRLRAAVGRQDDKLTHIPGTLPIAAADATLSAGYGIRRDPVSGQRTFHPGIDFAASTGTPVYATADGRVEVAERKETYGNCVDIAHGYNYLSRYAHLSEILVEPGQYVKRGDLIGKVGSTGKSSAPHLHYEVRFKGESQNPVNFCFLDLTPEQFGEMLRIADDAGQVLD